MKKNARGWLARCPAHEDKAPSLSIGEGRAGAILLRCFRGCTAAEIVAAIGLELQDLWPPSPELRSSRPWRAPTHDELRAALEDEAAAFRVSRGIVEHERLLPAERNAIRHSVAVRLGLSIAPVPSRPWDSACGGRERDRAWPAILRQAWWQAWLEYHGTDTPPELGDVETLPPDEFARAQALAAQWLREIAAEGAAA